jgi:uncharacterized membrane protein
MAQTATKRRNAHAARRTPTSKRRREPVRPVEKVKDAAPSAPSVGKLTRRAGRKAMRKLVGKLADAGSGALRSAVSSAGRAVSSGASSLDSGNGVVALGDRRRLPIQRSVDIAVPIGFAWEEWMRLCFLPEGVHKVVNIERDGNELFGRIPGARSRDWAAEVLDEREQESFAWQSTEGSDCAGLVTFHDLSRRLTRLELTLDVIPTSAPEAIALLTHLADHHAEAELRRFKARLELINPDLYENDEDEQPEAPEPKTND